MIGIPIIKILGWETTEANGIAFMVRTQRRDEDPLLGIEKLFVFKICLSLWISPFLFMGRPWLPIWASGSGFGMGMICGGAKVWMA